MIRRWYRWRCKSWWRRCLFRCWSTWTRCRGSEGWRHRRCRRRKRGGARPKRRAAGAGFSSCPRSELARVEIFLILLEFRFDIGARVDTLRKSRDARGRENGLEAGAVAHNDFGERELAIVTEDERVAED